MTDKPIAPRGINHLVLNVRNMEDPISSGPRSLGFSRSASSRKRLAAQLRRR